MDKSLQAARNYISKMKPKTLRTAVLEHKATSAFEPDFCAHKIIKWRWIAYPWARHENVVNLVNRAYKRGMSPGTVRAKIHSLFQAQTHLKEIIIPGALAQDIDSVLSL